MLFIVGSVVVIACVIGGYIANGGHMEVLFQPFEWLIIVGAAIGAFIISNRKPVLSQTLGAITGLLKSERYDKDAYLELLEPALSRSSSWPRARAPLALEAHVRKSGGKLALPALSRLPLPTTMRWSSCATICASSPSAPTTITRWRR